jgi:hypothetical protein
MVVAWGFRIWGMLGGMGDGWDIGTWEKANAYDISRACTKYTFISHHLLHSLQYSKTISKEYTKNTWQQLTSILIKSLGSFFKNKHLINIVNKLSLKRKIKMSIMINTNK